MTKKEYEALLAQQNSKTFATLNVELYTENGMMCAYIGDDMGGSGIKVVGETAEEVAENMKDYIINYFYE